MHESHRVRRALAVPALAAILLAGCGSSGGSSPSTTIVAKPGEQIIHLKSLVFEPKKLTVPRGTKLIFVWDEKVAHNVVFLDGGPKSKTMNEGPWSPEPGTLDTPGTYKFVCALHPGMAGEVTITG